MFNKHIAKFVDKLLKIRNDYFKTCEAKRIADNLHNTILKPLNPYDEISKYLNEKDIEYIKVNVSGHSRVYVIDSEGEKHGFGLDTGHELFMEDKFGPNWFRNYYFIKDGQFIKYQDRENTY